MKKMIMLSFLLAFLFYSKRMVAQYGTAWAKDITYIVSDCNNDLSCKKIIISNIPYNARGYHVHWDFGDGSYEEYDTIVSEQNSTFSIFKTHSFYKSGNLNVTVQLTRRYKDEDDPPRITIPTGNVNANGQAVPVTTKGLELIYSIMPRAGDTVLYGVAYKNHCAFPLSANIKLIYEDDKVDIVRIPDGGSVKKDWGQNNRSNLIIPFSNLGVGGQITSFFDVTFKEGKVNDEPLFFEVTLEKTPGVNMCILSGDSIPDVVYELDTVKSHDPNYLMANLPSKCVKELADQKEITYTIVFQNVGTGPVSHVTVVDYVPEYFKLKDKSDIRMKEPNSNLDFDLDTIARTITWVKKISDKTLKPKNKEVDATGSKSLTSNAHHMLQGTGSPEYKAHLINKDSTIDTISFILTFDPKVPLPPCGVIVNRAVVYFDKDYTFPVMTNDFYTNILCDSFCIQPCFPDFSQKKFVGPISVAPQTQTRLDILDSLSQLMGVVIDNSYEFNWYPSLLLDNPSSQRPIISPQTNKLFEKEILYTLVVSKGCQKQIFKVLVRFDGNEEGGDSGGGLCWWWWLLLTIPLSVWAYFKFKKK